MSTTEKMCVSMIYFCSLLCVLFCVEIFLFYFFSFLLSFLSSSWFRLLRDYFPCFTSSSSSLSAFVNAGSPYCLTEKRKTHREITYFSFSRSFSLAFIYEFKIVRNVRASFFVFHSPRFGVMKFKQQTFNAYYFITSLWIILLCTVMIWQKDTFEWSNKEVAASVFEW